MTRKIFLLPLLFLYFISPAQSDREKAQIMSELIAQQRFEFVAESAIPLRGRTIFISGQYTLTVLPDSLQSNLPYYGRAFQAPTNLSGGGINFISTDFSYSVIESKKRWTIVIKPKDSPHAEQMYLIIWYNGSASLQVTSINRQSISFDGYVRKPSK